MSDASPHQETQTFPVNNTFPVDHIIIDAGSQTRVEMNDDVVAEYAKLMGKAGLPFPPIVLFHHDDRYVLADGFHRLAAAKRKHLTTIRAEIHQGTKTDALMYALRANAKHGLRRTNKDKIKSIEMAFAAWPDFSSHSIAEICGVSPDFANRHRRKLSLEDSSTKRIGKDGKQRRLPVRKSKPLPSLQNELSSNDTSTLRMGRTNRKRATLNRFVDVAQRFHKLSDVNPQNRLFIQEKFVRAIRKWPAWLKEALSAAINETHQR